MLIMINRDNKMKMKQDNVRIIRIILDLHGVIVDLRKVVLFEYGKPLLSRKMVEGQSKIWKQSNERKARQCSEFCR